MASNLILKSGSPLIGSPILYQVTAASPVGEVSFQRVKMYVKAGLSSEGVYYDYEFSQPVAKGETVAIDISSALQAVADKYEYTPVPPTRYPYIQFSLEACDEYMQNGQNSGDVGKTTNPGGRALMGAFSDLERLRASQSGRTTSRFSRKPTTTPETVCVGDIYLRPRAMSVNIGNITAGPEMSTYTIAGEGSHTLWANTDDKTVVYALPQATRDRYQMRFVNGLGCVESVSVLSLMASEVNYTTDEYVKSRQEQFGMVSRGVVRKQNDHERWRLSSGAVDRAWQQWFLHEMLMTPQAWIMVDGTWIPCHVIPEETVSGIDRQKASLLEVLFTVRFDIAGSPFVSMLI